jgi:hypothetical protein
MGFGSDFGNSNVRLFQGSPFPLLFAGCLFASRDCLSAILQIGGTLNAL